MAKITYAKHGPKLLGVYLDGTFKGWLEQDRRRPATGLQREAYTFWFGTVAGQPVRATTLTAVKALVARRLGA